MGFPVSWEITDRSNLIPQIQAEYDNYAADVELRTIDDSGHPPETQQDEETNPIEGVLAEDQNNVQHKGNYHHHTIKHLKLVVEKLSAVSKHFAGQLHHEKGQ